MEKDRKVRLDWVPEAYQPNDCLNEEVSLTKSVIYPLSPIISRAPLRGTKQSRKRYKR